MKIHLQGATLLSLTYHASCLLNQRADHSIVSPTMRNLPLSMISSEQRSQSGTKSEGEFYLPVHVDVTFKRGSST